MESKEARDPVDQLRQNLDPVVGPRLEEIDTPEDIREGVLAYIKSLDWKKPALVLGVVVMAAFLMATMWRVATNPEVATAWNDFIDSALHTAYIYSNAVQLTFQSILNEGWHVLQTSAGATKDVIVTVFTGIWSFIVQVVAWVMEPVNFYFPSFQDLLDLGGEVMAAILRTMKPLTDHLRSVGSYVYGQIKDIETVQVLAKDVKASIESIGDHGKRILSNSTAIVRTLEKVRDVPADLFINLLGPMLRSAFCVQFFAMAASLKKLTDHAGEEAAARVSYFKTIVVALALGKLNPVYKSVSFIVSQAAGLYRYTSQEVGRGNLSLRKIAHDTRVKIDHSVAAFMRISKANPLLLVFALIIYYSAVAVFSIVPMQQHDYYGGWKRGSGHGKKKRKTKKHKPLKRYR